ncbi:hypothetical protein HYFRA_00006953 [Hymenoscyphus fraxineus]|uniref:Uncharacterized protein n=1 Tax=Hymenoscyphus fraxineus TaxID=746836 RepID=A0A9N9KRW9_9HELO|nr:hypothetical protein HYFRA_00006953 [Hymenoscyphus fraxineus]
MDSGSGDFDSDIKTEVGTMPTKQKPKAKGKSKQPKPMTSVPLICSICPKSPQFSDMSHLLTHISSKSHLANKFKLTIRSESEPAAKKELEEFEFWYINNNLPALLSERMAVKDQKRAAKDRKNKLACSLPVAGGNFASPVSTWKKKEDTISASSSVLEQTPIYRAPVPHMHLWPTTRSGGRATTPTADDWATGHIFETPVAARRPKAGKRKMPHGDDNLDPRLITPEKLDDDDDEEEKATDPIDSAVKLKGIFWPGMDLFDSATPAMKKRRNQKKEVRVLKNLMAISEEVQPVQVSYFANGEVRESRDIFGPLSDVEDAEPPKGPSPKKRKARKPAMSNASTNAPKLRAARKTKASARGSPSKLPTMSSMPSMQAPSNHGLFMKPIPTLNPLAPAAGMTQGFVPTREEDEEFKLTMGNMGNLRKKIPFEIYQEAPEDSPGHTESSLEDHRFDFSSHALPQPTGNSSSGTHVSPTPAPKPAPSRPVISSGKENTRPEIRQTPPEMQPQSNFHHRRPLAPSQGMFPSYSPHLFYDAFHNPLFSQDYARPFAYTSHDHNLNFTDNMKASGYASNFNGDFRPITSMTRTTLSHSINSMATSNTTTGEASNHGLNFDI